MKLTDDTVIHNVVTGQDITIEHNPDHGTLVHVPDGMYQAYRDSRKLEAWLIEEDDNCYPLWWIVNYGVVGREYTVCDDLTGSMWMSTVTSMPRMMTAGSCPIGLILARWTTSRTSA